MKRFVFTAVLATSITFNLTACNSTSNTSADFVPLSEETKSLGIEDVPDTLSKTYSVEMKFNRYTKVLAPNGKAIHLIAQDKLSDNQIVRARSVLEHYLTPLPNSQFGSDKTQVANKMADNNAILLLLNGEDDGSNPATELDGQPLYQNEIQVEGHKWYINQNYDHRDATFEEILHLVHDYGIGVDQVEVFMGSLPEFQAKVRQAQSHALAHQLWGGGAEYRRWIKELTEENSLSQEYLASVIDSYYGLWGAWSKSNTHGMWGIYTAKSRKEIALEDTLGAELMNNKFFHSYLTYNARIDESFAGDFSLRFNESVPYTHHSQYLKSITLTGSNPSNVIVNSMDNDITGNEATNKVFFSGHASAYTIEKHSDGSIIVKDKQQRRDGTNYLSHVEKLVFKDKTIIL
ncbi:hypothetical protein [Vibrio penaeicida]|uniref:hypothetical protein n=1 Tax=Vibrio penaeicida TaxID=104609 RepID=UPI000CEA1467|nr:hypothetical protein [Vibrio penaeicida]